MLVEVAFAPSFNRTQLTISLNGSDISDRFTQTAATTLQALLTDLPLGDSALLVEHSPQQLSESLTLTNYPSGRTYYLGASRAALRLSDRTIRDNSR